MVAFPATISFPNLDPANIRIAHEYVLLENLYSTLIEKNSSVGIEASIAEKFFWDGNDLVLDIRENAVGSDGQAISAEDVVFSLKRLLVLGTSNHGDLKQLLCNVDDLKTVKSDCEGIVRQGSRITLKFKHKNQFIIDTLATQDFAIVPERAVDPKTLKIENFGVTSGPYYVDSAGSDLTILLANKHHYSYSDKMPQIIHLVSYETKPDQSIPDMKSGKLDMLTMFDSSSSKARFEEFANDDNFRVATTAPTHVHFLVFTKKGRRISPSRRWHIANALRNALQPKHSSGQDFVHATNVFFMNSGFGGLDAENTEALTEKLKLRDPDETGQGVSIGLFPSSLAEFEGPIRKALPQLKIFESTDLPTVREDLNDINSMPDLTFLSFDVGLGESLPEITMALNAGLLGETQTSRDLWLDSYVNEQSISRRKASLEKLHTEALMSPMNIPIQRLPYIAVLKKGWKADWNLAKPHAVLFQVRKD